jgi:hypothetical protein
MSSIWVRTNYHLWWCCVVVLPEVTWPEVTSVTCPVQKYVLRMHYRATPVTCPESEVCSAHATGNCAISALVTSEGATCPEVALTGRMFCACPVSPPLFFLSSSTKCWLGCSLRRPRPIFSMVTGWPKVTWHQRRPRHFPIMHHYTS